MSLKITHKNSTAAGTPPAAGDIDVGEIAINAADAKLFTKDTNGAIQEFISKFEQSGGGAVARTVESKLQDVVSVKDFGAVGDGVTDDTVAIQAAIDAVSAAGGGTVTAPSVGKYLVDTTLDIKINVSLVGPHEYVGSPGSNAAAPYGAVQGVLIINSAATITLRSNSSLKGFLIYRKGISFPVTSVAAFAGTAITIDGEDVGVSHCQILGFNKAIYSTGWQRQRINSIWFDCNNGIEITDCLDIAYINQCHGWPFTTIEHVAGGGAGSLLTRSGSAFNLRDTVDWARITDCFSYGYFRGFNVVNVNYAVLTSCGADNITNAGVPGQAGSVGFNVGGGQGVTLTNCTTAAQSSAGIVVSLNPNVQATVIGATIFNCTDHGILLQSGDLMLVGSSIETCNSGVSTGVNTARIMESANRFKNILSGRCFTLAAGSTNSNIALSSETIHVGASAGAPKANNLSLTSVASSDSLLLPANGDAFLVTGTTSFGSIAGGWGGRIVTLVFADVLTVFDGGATVKLAGGNFVTSADDTLMLLYTGTAWVELGRSAN